MGLWSRQHSPRRVQPKKHAGLLVFPSHSVVQAELRVGLQELPVIILVCRSPHAVSVGAKLWWWCIRFLSAQPSGQMDLQEPGARLLSKVTLPAQPWL